MFTLCCVCPARIYCTLLSPALKTGQFTLPWVFYMIISLEQLRKIKDVWGVPGTLSSGISQLWVLALAIAVMCPSCRGEGTRENKLMAIPSCGVNRNPTRLTMMRTLLYGHLHLQLLAPVWFICPVPPSLSLSSASYRSGPTFPTVLHLNQATPSSWLHGQVVLKTKNHRFPLVLASGLRALPSCNYREGDGQPWAGARRGSKVQHTSISAGSAPTALVFLPENIICQISLIFLRNSKRSLKRKNAVTTVF